MAARLPRPTIAAMWLTYKALCYPGGMARTQEQECRRAFYAGIKGWIDVNLHTLDPGEEPTVEDMKWIEDRYEELTAFGVEEAESRVKGNTRPPKKRR